MSDQVRLSRGEYPTLTYVGIGRLNLAFSYETCVAFGTPDDGWVVSENVWSKTTGKHLNAIVSKTFPRVPHAEFTARLDAILATVAVGAVT